MNQSSRILQTIASKGGLYGQLAALYLYDQAKEDQFIVECFEQCHNKAAINHFGKELVIDIILYRLELIRRPLRELLGINALANEQGV